MTPNNFPDQFDVAVVGGGINGAVSAAALSSRGLKVLLIDRQDFGAETSSQSSNLIWGGIKYLQSLEFGLVFKLCRARLRLMTNYPNRVRSTGFLAALGPNAPFGKLFGTLGTLLYWAIGLFRTPAPKTFGLAKTRTIEPGMGGDQLKGSVLYFDAMLPDNDARFVWDFVSKAENMGATVLNYVGLEAAEKDSAGFRLKLRDSLTEEKFETSVKVIVNAAGPFVRAVNDLLNVPTQKQLLYSKGIHLIVPRLTEDHRILAFWDEEGRLFYVIPMHDRSVIGTTDTRVTDPTEQVTDQDREFVLRQINASMHLAAPLTKQDIISERCGVRALVVNQGSKSDNQDWHKLSRKHFVETDSNGVISILGGKFTDCLNVGDEIIDAVSKFLPLNEKASDWIGEGSQSGFKEFMDRAISVLGRSNQTQELITQLWRRHGIDGMQILNRMELEPSERELVFEGLWITIGELRYVAKEEAVRTASDLLRRRLPIAMVRTPAEIQGNQKLQKLLLESGLR